MFGPATREVTPWMGLDLSFTGDVSFNNKPDSSIGQSAVRSFAFGAGLTWSTFLDILPSKGPITISAVGKVTRNEDSDHTIGNAQARLSVPIGAGLRLPIAVTYASRTNTSSKAEVMFNVGLTMDMEQITSWMQIGRLARAIGGRSAL